MATILPFIKGAHRIRCVSPFSRDVIRPTRCGTPLIYMVYVVGFNKKIVENYFMETYGPSMTWKGLACEAHFEV